MKSWAVRQLICKIHEHYYWKDPKLQVAVEKHLLRETIPPGVLIISLMFREIIHVLFVKILSHVKVSAPLIFFFFFFACLRLLLISKRGVLTFI